MSTRRPPRQRNFAEHVETLARQIAGERLVGVRNLFLAVGARPPVVQWNPTPENLREPRLVAAMEFWRGLAASGSFQPLDVHALDPLGATAHYTMILEPLENGGDFYYRSYGRALMRHYGRDLAGQRLSGVAGHVSRFAGAVYRAVMLRREPLYTEHEPPTSVFVRQWSRVMLPLTDAHGVVTQILVASVPEDPIRAIVDTVIDGVLVVDECGLVRIVNPAGAALLRGMSQDLVGQPISRLLRWPDTTPSGAVAERLIGRVSEAVARCLDGREFPAEVSIGETSHGESRLLVAVIRDVSQRKASEAEMRRLAYHDPLTGAANRALLEDRLAEGLARARREHGRLALILFDLDDFKGINDAYGHAVGDGVLVGLARRLRPIVRETDLLARLGGDEFAVLLTGLRSASGASAFARRLLHRLAQPLEVAGRSHPVTASFGIAVWPEAGETAELLLQRADEALYAAKHQGGSRCILYPPGSEGLTTAPTFA
jgi:diguanylate cyclase (GGDEF)-like protein/PAS domain S-box-containing protein